MLACLHRDRRTSWAEVSAEFVDYDVHFKQCLRLLKFVDGYTFKCLNWLVGVLRVECIWIVT